MKLQTIADVFSRDDGHSFPDRRQRKQKNINIDAGVPLITVKEIPRHSTINITTLPPRADGDASLRSLDRTLNKDLPVLVTEKSGNAVLSAFFSFEQLKIVCFPTL